MPASGCAQFRRNTLRQTFRKRNRTDSFLCCSARTIQKASLDSVRSFSAFSTFQRFRSKKITMAMQRTHSMKVTTAEASLFMGCARPASRTRQGGAVILATSTTPSAARWADDDEASSQGVVTRGQERRTLDSPARNLRARTPTSPSSSQGSATQW